MEYLAELYILALELELELEFSEECTKAVYKEIAALEKELQLDTLAA